MMDICNYLPGEKEGTLRPVMKSATELGDELAKVLDQSDVHDFEWYGPVLPLSWDHEDAERKTTPLPEDYSDLVVYLYPGNSEGYLVNVDAISQREGVAPMRVFLGKTFDREQALRAVTRLTEAIHFPEKEAGQEL
jgi:hypothetical protein